ncbi:hypothetical protein CB0940_00608, partial [Cercospora beticola]
MMGPRKRRMRSSWVSTCWKWQQVKEIRSKRQCCRTYAKARQSWYSNAQALDLHVCAEMTRSSDTHGGEGTCSPPGKPPAVRITALVDVSRATLLWSTCHFHQRNAAMHATAHISSQNAGTRRLLASSAGPSSRYVRCPFHHNRASLITTSNPG